MQLIWTNIHFKKKLCDNLLQVHDVKYHCLNWQLWQFKFIFPSIQYKSRVHSTGFCYGVLLSQLSRLTNVQILPSMHRKIGKNTWDPWKHSDKNLPWFSLSWHAHVKVYPGQLTHIWGPASWWGCTWAQAFVCNLRILLCSPPCWHVSGCWGYHRALSYKEKDNYFKRYELREAKRGG